MVKSGLVSLVPYNNIQLEHQLMSLHQEFSLFANEEYHFYDGQAYRYQNEIEILMDRSGLDKNYMDQGPNFQMEELLKDLVFECPIKTNTQEDFQKWDQSLPTPKIIQKNREKNPCKKQKKIKKSENSPFHNFQKHLNNALKKLIIVPEFHPEEGPQKQAAVEIWKAYCRCEVKTKRILHFIFNEKNEHMINDSELKTYGLFGVYQRFGEETVAQARAYLSKLAIDQIDRQNIEGYLKSRKLRTKEGFEEYILNFRTELENGYLKRRINVEK